MSESDHDSEDTLPLVYANWSRALGNVHDLALDLGYRTGQLPPRADIRLVITWQYAAVLREMLNHLIEQYEEESGEVIRTPEGMQFGRPEFLPKS
jgi:hypothetical protein